MFDPYFDSVAAFIAMGEHGFFVWSAYGLSALLIVTNMLVAVRRLVGQDGWCGKYNHVHYYEKV